MPLLPSTAGWHQPGAERPYGFSPLFRCRQRWIAPPSGVLIVVIPTWWIRLDDRLRDSICYLYRGRFASDLLVGGLMLASGLLVEHRGETQAENLLAVLVAVAIAGAVMVGGAAPGSARRTPGTTAA